MDEKIEYLEKEIKSLLENKKYHDLRKLLEEENETDLAEVFETINNNENVVLLFRLLPKDEAAEVFAYLPIDQQQTLIQSLSNTEVGQILNDLNSDDAVDMLEEMPANVVKKILALADPQTRQDINSLLQYPEDSAGSIMTVEFIDLRSFMTINDAIERIRKKGIDSETINYCYVTDGQKHLLGVISLREIILAKPEEKIEDLMDDNIIIVTTLQDQEEVAKLFKKYDFAAMPVVDQENRLVGIITVDDVMDILEEEVTEDIEKMAAITPNDQPYMKTSVLETYKKRIPWLLLLMISASITGKIIQGFETALASCVVLTAFIPMLMDTGGNCGSQASVSVIRALSLDELDFHELPLVIWKEFRVSFLIGLTLALCNFLKVIVVDRVSITIAFVVCFTLFLTVITAKLVGCVLPVIASKLGFDPAVMASPFITTIVDALSLLLFFNIAAVFLGI
ncbi:magnesium transporter [[Clostridium] spiroforme]|nr:magnesium transporter [Thomasclavelia spiroformis]MBM6879850.1 magnesium transporter [Thomasclavelia spiroformis]